MFQNWSNMSSTEDFEVFEDTLVVACWALLGVYAFVSNLFVIAGIMAAKSMAKLTSYWLITSLAVCDMCEVFICFLHIMPSTLLRDRHFALVSLSNAAGIFCYNLFWYAGVVHLQIMAINRYVSICRPKLYLRYFSGRRTLTVIAGAYVVGAAISLPGLWPCCYVIWDYDMYAARYAVDGTPYGYVDWAINGLSIVIMFYCYLKIFLKVRNSRVLMQKYRRMCRTSRSQARLRSLSDAPKVAAFEQRKPVFMMKRRRPVRAGSRIVRLIVKQTKNYAFVSRREVRLFVQFATVSLVFLVSLATWQWLPRLSASKWVGFIVTSLFFVNNATNPSVYLCFNSALRHQIAKLLCAFRPVAEQHDSFLNVHRLHTYPGAGKLGRLRALKSRSRTDEEEGDDSSTHPAPSVTALATTGMMLTAAFVERVQRSGGATCSSMSAVATSETFVCPSPLPSPRVHRHPQPPSVFAEDPDTVILVETESVHL